ncbi:TonB family protein [Pelagicoccus albus]|uniref:TonB family protein n=1 Tax=Pelagicoccus albus TaxID=415222 RepID=A0A7X1B7S0_9BACT|nr:TonB family protein [Pelagicoccus albus]MBC2607112.1 TonB family protein [Pelagicoccus albus]
MKRSLLITAISLLYTVWLPVGKAAELENDRVKEVSVIDQTKARFPGAMRVVGIEEGFVSVAVLVDEEGNVSDTLVLESTGSAFTNSALKAIEEWSFRPAQLQGSTVPSSAKLDFDFRLDEELRWQIQAPAQADITHTTLSEDPISFTPFDELDRIPLPIRITEPNSFRSGSATIEFYIDETGSVRCPSVISSPSLNLGRELVDTVVGWSFEIPLKSGRPTNTRVRQTFACKDGKLSSASNGND